MADLATTADVPEPTGSGADREYALVPLERIQVHPLNLRRELRGIEELTDSVRQNGLLEPVLLVPAPETCGDGGERYVLIAGHRRHAACVAAKHDPVESIIRRDLDSEGAQVIAMLTENGPRDDLTPIEEAHGYQLALSLNGLTPSRLARRLGKPRATIADRVALTRLPEPVQDRVHGGQITLQDAEALVEFASDRHVLDELLLHVGTSAFRYRVEHVRRSREVKARIAAVRRQLEETGVRVIEPPERYTWGSVEKPVAWFTDPEAPVADDGTPTGFTAAAHATACSFHAVFVDPNSQTPQYVCADPTAAGHQRVGRPHPTPAVGHTAAEPAPAPGPSPEEIQAAEEAEQRRAEEARLEAERREALEVAGRVRATFLASTVRHSGRAHLTAVLRLLLEEHFVAWLDDANLEDASELAGLIDARLSPETEEEGTLDDRLDEVARDLRAALDGRRSADALAGALLAITAQDREYALREGFGWSNPSCRRYLDFLIAQGYEPTEIERELLDRQNGD